MSKGLIAGLVISIVECVRMIGRVRKSTLVIVLFFLLMYAY